MRYSIIIISVLMAFLGFSQGDSVKFSKDIVLNEGLYLGYGDLRRNEPIPKEKIVTSINKEQLDFYSRLLEGETIGYAERDGSKAKIQADNVWGYCQNNVIYINYKKNFFRVSSFGAVCFFIAVVEVNAYSPGYNVFINGPPSNAGSAKVKEYREILFRFYTGEFSEFSTDELLELFKPDAAIYKEYAALNKKKKKDLAPKYIRLYNEKHPVYFPGN